jgi:uncharacterized protein YegP (UPF0339 family)
MAHPEFQVKTGRDGQYYFNLTARNGQVILASEGYKAKEGCENCIETLKKISQDEKSFVRKTTKDGQSYFMMRAANGQSVGRSETYKTKESMENGIKSVKTNAPQAEVHYL